MISNNIGRPTRTFTLILSVMAVLEMLPLAQAIHAGGG
jgi:hypothetical protein